MKTVLIVAGATVAAASALALECQAQTYGQIYSHAGSPAYVSPRLPLGYAALGQGHAVYSPQGYRAPNIAYGAGPPIYVDAAPVRVAPDQIYVVIPDIRVRPSEVIIEPPVIHFVAQAPAVEGPVPEEPGTDD